MNPNDLDAGLAAVSSLLTSDLKAARAVFEETLGVSHKDKSFDAELRRLQAEPYVEGKDLAIPQELALAFLLREGSGRGRGKLTVPKYVMRGDQLVIKRTLRRKAELMAADKSKSAPEAEGEAAYEVAAEDADERSRPLSEEQILYALRHVGKPRRGKT